ncbi:LOW QUALITY PROTEIN: RING finger protein 212B-like [Harpia harpyja]|uniref:LOW QUALITY PROTEIN: RING finger protein 212B-like n=1 Tax=Harpia harpyja TaxID=202280 RepID=UPI0022B19CA7|nr:LOW QUALITY PROTEIN: RING finger protein 212B-like [Harpia harpyja]
MRPQEKLFFKSPADMALKHLTHISQVWRFQQAQADLLLASHKEAARVARAALEDVRHVLDTRNRELEALRRENGELRRAQLSPGWRGGQQVRPPPWGFGGWGGLRRHRRCHPRISPTQEQHAPAGSASPPRRRQPRLLPPPNGADPQTPPRVPWAPPPPPAAIFPPETPPSHRTSALRPPPPGA